MNTKDTTQQQALERAKLQATGWLVAATVLFIITLLLRARYPWLDFVRAFCEAAMVGGLADWFAVTALFRHPLGIPIPHTALIPLRQKSIARSFGTFIKNNFIAPDVVARKMHNLDIARQGAQWLSREEHSAQVADLVAAGIYGSVELARDEDVQELLESTIVSLVRSAHLAPGLGRLLGFVLNDARRQLLLDLLAQMLDSALLHNKDMIRGEVRQRVPAMLRAVGVDNAVYQQLVAGLGQTVRAFREDENHPLRTRINQGIDTLIDELQHSPERAARLDAVKEQVLSDPSVREFSAALWQEVKQSLQSRAGVPDPSARESIARGLSRAASRLLQDEQLLIKVNHWVEDTARFLAQQYGDEIAIFVEQTISAWDSSEASRRIELQVGRDLQYIRINGTLVGGLAGLVIHSVSLLLT